MSATLPIAVLPDSGGAGPDRAVVSRVRRREGKGVSNVSVAKVIEITSTSPGSFEDAIRKGIAKAQMSIDGIRGAWISEHKVELAEDGTIKHFRVDMKLTFVLE
jgi:flavin-binding protein dodecin